MSTAPFAFYASMTRTDPTIGSHQSLIFDHVLLNIGNGYHPNLGVFTAPKSGVYVFMWTLRIWEQSIVLLVNGVDYTSIFSRAFDHDHTVENVMGADESVTGYAVARVNQGEDVFLRTHSAYKGKEGIFDIF